MKDTHVDAPAYPPAAAEVAAIVVSFNSANDLPACLLSLETQHGRAVSIHVVDNASADDSVAIVRRDHPGVHLTVNETNVGFGAANNQVLLHRPAAYYVLVNPDTVISSEAVDACVHHLERHPRAGIAAVRLVNPDGTLQRSCYSFLGIANLFGETIGAHRLIPWLRPLSSLYMPWFAHDREVDVDWIAGAFMVARGDAVRQVGGFDADFFMYGEEMDWCRRFRKAGWRVVFLPTPSVVHKGGASSEPVAGPMFVENLKGRLRFIRKHDGPIAATTARGLVAMSVVARYLRNKAAGAWLRLRGRDSTDARRVRGTMFQAAIRWVLRGMPVDGGAVPPSGVR